MHHFQDRRLAVATVCCPLSEWLKRLCYTVTGIKSRPCAEAGKDHALGAQRQAVCPAARFANPAGASRGRQGAAPQELQQSAD